MRMVHLKGIGISVLILGLGTSGWALGLSGTAGVGLVDMPFLNGQLEFLANRAGTTFSPLRLAWEGGFVVWPWPWFGLGGSWLASSGQVHGRDPETQTVNAWGVALHAGLPRLIPTWPLGLRVAAGLSLASLSGPVTGGGLGWDLSATIEWRFLQLGPLAVTATVTARYFPVPTVRDVRGNAVETRGAPAADFSGLYVELALSWR